MPAIRPRGLSPPNDWSPSSFVARHAKEVASRAPGPILDVASGYGRNAACIAKFGSPVVCLDRDRRALGFIDNGGWESFGVTPGLLDASYIELEQEPWPYRVDAVGAIVCVHWQFEALLAEFSGSLRNRGYLLLESIGGQGSNYLSLPRAGVVQAALKAEFDLKYVQERRVGPVGVDAVTVKILAVKN